MKQLLITIALLTSTLTYAASEELSLCANEENIQKGYECKSMSQIFCLIEKESDQYELLIGNTSTGVKSSQIINKENYQFDHTDETLVFHKKELIGKDFQIYSSSIVVDKVYGIGSIETNFEDATSFNRNYKCTKI